METPEMGVSILIDGVGKPFSVRPAADDDLLCRKPEMGVSILSDRVGKPFSVLHAADDDLVLVLLLESNVLTFTA